MNHSASGRRRQQLLALGQEPGRHGADQAVAADAAVPVTERRDGLGVDVLEAVRICNQHKVVARSVAFGKLQDRSGGRYRRQYGQRLRLGFVHAPRLPFRPDRSGTVTQALRRRQNRRRPQRPAALATRSGSCQSSQVTRIRTEPGQLPARELPGGDDGVRPRPAPRLDSPSSTLEELGVAEGPRRGPPAAARPRPAGGLRPASPRSTIAWTRSARRAGAVRGPPRVRSGRRAGRIARLRHEGAEWPPGELEDFQGADDPALIAEPAGGDGVNVRRAVPAGAPAPRWPVPPRARRGCPGPCRGIPATSRAART